MTHVLVVDDDAHILRTLRIHLAAHGYTVATADTGRQAIHAAVQRGKPRPVREHHAITRMRGAGIDAEDDHQ